MPNQSDRRSSVGQTPCVQRERIDCPNCGNPISVPKDFVRTGGIVRCNSCGTAYRRLPRPRYMWDYSPATEYDQYERYFYFDKSKPELYVVLHIRSLDEFNKAREQHGTLYIQVQKKTSGDQFEFRGVMTALPRK